MSIKIDRNEILEMIYACSNAAHAEYHLVEMLTINKDEAEVFTLNKSLQALRQIRIDLFDELNKKIPNVNPLWCVYKHLFLLQFHLFEIYEKNLDSNILSLSQNVMSTIDELMSVELNNWKKCPHCKEQDV